jgi:hypothetical protein
MSRSVSMFALVAILGTGLAVFAGEAIAMRRQPVPRARCEDCHAVHESRNAAIAVDPRTGERALIRYPAYLPMPLSVDHGR